MSEREYRFRAALQKNPDMDAAYVVFPHDVRREFGKGRAKVRATFDGEPYEGSIVNMGVKDAQGNICYVIGVTKAIRRKIGKGFGEEIDVTIVAADAERP